MQSQEHIREQDFISGAEAACTLICPESSVDKPVCARFCVRTKETKSLASRILESIRVTRKEIKSLLIESIDSDF